MTPNVQLEVERKYEVPTGADIDWSTLPVLTLEEEAANRDLEAVYFDTPTNHLAAFDIALRRRKGGPDAGWHLKYRDQLGKHELHVPLLKTSDRMPAQMKQYVAGLLAGQELSALATVATNRKVLNVQHPDFGHVAEICMDDVAATDERSGLKRTWVEYEVELVNGSGADGTAVFDELETVLLAGGLTPSSSTAKIARALGADDDAPAVTVVHPEKGKKSTKKNGSKQKPTAQKKEEPGKGGKKSKSPSGAENTGDTTQGQVRELVSACVDRLLYADFLLRIGDAEGVHAMRVAARRLIAVIEGLGKELTGQSHQDLAEQLSQLSDQLSAARDAEVVVELLPERARIVGEEVSSAGLGQLKALAQSHRESTRAAAVRMVNGKAHLQLLADLSAWAQKVRLSAKAGEWSAKKVATRAVKRWSKAVSTAEAALAADPGSTAGASASVRGATDDADGADGTGDADQPAPEEGPEPATKISRAVDLVHVHRKALRNLRYGLDGLAATDALVPKKAWRGLLDGSQEIQGELSDMMDSAVMDDWFAFAARSLIRTGGDRYVVGMLHGQERARIQGYERRAPEMINRLLSEVSPDA